MKKRGFTLIELLAVIVILAIIALITTPMILNIAEQSRKSSATRSAEGILKSAKNYYMQNELKENIINNEIDLTSDILEYDGERPEKGTIIFNKNGNVFMAIYLRGYCITKTFKGNIQIDKKTNEECIVELQEYKDLILNGADPELDSGMIPVVIENNGVVKKADIYDEWYNYTKKEWANAVLVNNDARDSYDAGDTILESDILAYFVWIPRYKYAIPEGTEQQINIVFENKSTLKSTGTAIGTDYYTHPTFTFGDPELDGVELNGLWVGKFETTGTVDNPTIKPNVSLTNTLKVSEQFKMSLKLGNRVLNLDGSITNNVDKTIYGLTSESRMMKNTEWGAVVYLSFSIYGINNKIEYNGGSKTGGGHYVNGEYQREYGIGTSYPQSTTGNITGIFDMAGGNTEIVMAVMEDSLNSGIPFAGYSDSHPSGFNGNYTQGGYSHSWLNYSNFPNSKYYDLYTYGEDSADFTRAIKGDATAEVKEWHQNNSFVDSTSPWFSRGGRRANGDTNPNILTFSCAWGGGVTMNTFRTVVTTN